MVTPRLHSDLQTGASHAQGVRGTVLTHTHPRRVFRTSTSRDPERHGLPLRPPTHLSRLIIPLLPLEPSTPNTASYLPSPRCCCHKSPHLALSFIQLSLIHSFHKDALMLWARCRGFWEFILMELRVSRTKTLMREGRHKRQSSNYAVINYTRVSALLENF